ncbi:MAG: MBL fold metallo-hydrolase [Rubrivivax sp.]
MTRAGSDPLAGLAVFERGWLSSNNVLIHAAAGEAGAWLVDTSHVNHAPQTLALLRQALAGRPLAGIANTHLHSDHCGGNALLQQHYGDVPIAIPPGQVQAVQQWDAAGLSYRSTGQRIERFSAGAVLQPGESLRAGGRDWELLEAPGHDPHMVMLFDRRHGVLLSADALWENGFGLVFPELQGEPGFDDLARVLELIAGLPVRVVVPGHGRPFDDVPAALARARQRLQGLRSDPARHARYAAKVLLKYHLMEEREQSLQALLQWTEATPLMQEVWQRFRPPGPRGLRQWAEQLVHELAGSGALTLAGDRVLDA